MAFQTNIFRDGEWVTETVDVHAVLKATAPKVPKKQRLLRPPECGILTRTVVDSQLVNTVLPARLRSPLHNDVAFIGDNFVQIRELNRDGQLQDVLRKNDFGSRIRNAAVIGTLPDKVKDESDVNIDLSIKTEDADNMLMDRGSPPTRSSMRNNHGPPQQLVLILECGDSVFLTIRPRDDGTWEFSASRFPRFWKQLMYAGFHLAVDPSSRYMVLGYARGCFLIHQLESIKNLNEQYRCGDPIRPVTSVRTRTVEGVIHKIEFLYPRPDDENHIILLLITVLNGKSRMTIYEWEHGDDLNAVFEKPPPGHRMPVENQMPLLIIPLTVRSAFILISPDQVAVCTETLHGPPNFTKFEISEAPATTNYHGLEKPLWTAWARPFRLSNFFKARDCIYLAREDGVVNFIEADSESTMTGSTFMDKFDCNISKAFTCLEDQYSDVLVMASDSGPGAVWKVPARQPLVQLSVLPNSFPVLDFATTDEYLTWNEPPRTPENGTALGSRPRLEPDRIFATSGQGQKGALTEYRYGLQAKIGLDFDYGIGLKQAWVVRAQFSGELGFNMLLSLPDRTGILHLSDDLSEAAELDPGSTQYDTSSRTLAAAACPDWTAQVTENCIVIISQSQSLRLTYDTIEGFPSSTVTDAAIADEYIAVSSHANNTFRISVLRIRTEAGRLSVAPVCCFQVDGDVTCLALYRSLEDGAVALLAGVWSAGRPLLAHAQVKEGGRSELEAVDVSTFTAAPQLEAQNSATNMEAVSSIASCEYDGVQIIMIGTRSGEVVNLTSLVPPRLMQQQRFGVSAANILVGNEPGHNSTILVSCDSNLVMLSKYSPASSQETGGAFKAMTRVWPVDASNPACAAPPVDSVTVLPRNLFSAGGSTTPLLILSGSRVLLAELSLQPGPVHRQMPLEGTPTKIIYSRHLQCLIVGLIKDDLPVLRFLDPDTGEDLGTPTGNDAAQERSPPEIGKQGDQILGLAEWEYEHGGRVWRFVVVSTRHGRLSVASADRARQPSDGGQSPRILYKVRFKKSKLEQPIYSVLGHPTGLFYCVGHVLHWDVLDALEKKLKNRETFELGSPATSLRLVNDKIVALTSRDSVEIVDYSADGGETSDALIHVDPQPRKTVHLMEVAGLQTDEAQSSIILVSDRECGVGGLWVPWRAPGKDCVPVFEADLPSSIRRFRRGRTRPYWEQGRHPVKYGRLPSTVDDAEILGVSLDGSLYHFTLLSVEVWRLLRFIQNLAVAAPELYPFAREEAAEYPEIAPEPDLERDPSSDPEPRLDRSLEMQIDGDMLQRCLDKGALERLMSNPDDLVRLAEILDDIDGGRHTEGFSDLAGGARDETIALTYDILEHFLVPVL